MRLLTRPEAPRVAQLPRAACCRAVPASQLRPGPRARRCAVRSPKPGCRAQFRAEDPFHPRLAAEMELLLLRCAATRRRPSTPTDGPRAAGPRPCASPPRQREEVRFPQRVRLRQYSGAWMPPYGPLYSLCRAHPACVPVERKAHHLCVKQKSIVAFVGLCVAWPLVCLVHPTKNRPSRL